MLGPYAIADGDAFARNDHNTELNNEFKKEEVDIVMNFAKKERKVDDI